MDPGCLRNTTPPRSPSAGPQRCRWIHEMTSEVACMMKNEEAQAKIRENALAFECPSLAMNVDNNRGYHASLETFLESKRQCLLCFPRFPGV